MQLQKLPSIWVDSALTIGFVSNGATIDKAKRFQYNSIYYKDDPTRPKKKMDQLMFPHQILYDFRKCIRDASKSKSKDKKRARKPYSLNDQEQKSFISSKASSVTKRLYKKPQILAGKHDLFGNRCTFNQSKLNSICHLPSSLNTKSIEKNSSSEKLYVSASQRLDLSRPINFNPGPGSYLVDSHQNKAKPSQSLFGQSAVLKKKKIERNLLQSISYESSAKSK